MSATSEHDQRLIEQIKLGRMNFIEEEVDSYSDDVLIEFTSHYAFLLEDLPKNRLSYVVLKAAINSDATRNPLEHFSSSDTPHYRELALLAVTKSSTQVKFVEPAFVDVDFCREAIANNQKTLYAFTKQYAPLLEQIFTQKEIEALVNSSGLNKHLIVGGVMKRAAKNTLFSEAFIKQAILDSPGLLTVALESEYKHLVNEILGTGDWPPSQVGDRPADIKEGVKRLMGSNTQVFNDWHKAYVLSFGIEKVVNAMKGPKALPLLETFYSREEIRPHLSGLQGQKAKGRWLEEELGL